MRHGKRRVTALGRSKNKSYRWDRSISGTSEAKCLKNLKSFQAFFEDTCSKSMDELREHLGRLEDELDALNASMNQDSDLIVAAQTLDKFEAMAERKGWLNEEYEEKRDRLFNAAKMQRFVSLGRRKEDLERDIERVEKGIDRAERFIDCLESGVFGSIELAIESDLAAEESKSVKSERPRLIQILTQLNDESGGNIAGLSQLFDLVMRKDSRLLNTWEALLIVERDAEERITDFVTEHYALIDDKETDRAHHAFELNQMEKAWNGRGFGDDVNEVFDEDRYTYLSEEEKRRELNLLGFEGRNEELERVHEFISSRQASGIKIDEEYKQALCQEIQANKKEMESESFVPTLGMRDEYCEYSLLIGPVYKAYVELRRNVMLLLFPGYRKEAMTARYSATETQQMRDEIQEELEEARRNWKEAKAEKTSAEQQIEKARTVWNKAKKKEETVDSRIATAQAALDKATEREQEFQQKLVSLEEKERTMLAEMSESKESLRQERNGLIEREKILEQKSADLEVERNALTEELAIRQGALDQQKNKLNTKEQEIADKEAALATMKLEITQLKSQLGRDTEELNSRRVSLAGHQEDHQTAALALEKAKQQFAKLSDDLTKQRESLESSKTAFDDEKKDFLKEKELFKEEREKQLAAIAQREEAITARSKDLDVQAQDLADRVALTEQVTKLEAQLRDLQDQNQQLQDNVAGASTEAESRRLSSVGHKQQETQLSRQVTELKAAQQAEVKNHAKEIAALQKRVAIFEKVKIELQRLCEKHEKASGSAQNERDQARADVVSATENSTALQEELDSLRGQLQSRQFHKVPGRIMWVAGSVSTFAFTAATLAVLTTLDTTLPAAALFANPAMSALFALAAVSVIVAVVGGVLEVTHQCKRISLLKAQSDGNSKGDTAQASAEL